MSFDYSQIPSGYYDKILYGPEGMRRFWHYHKFESVLRYIPKHLQGPDKAILDVGSFGGSFLGMIPNEVFGYQLGIDILKEQIDFANRKYATPYREFKINLKEFLDDSALLEKFHVITIIEVIEHMTPNEIKSLLESLCKVLHPEGSIIITTPNYLSMWPILEITLNLMSDVKYEEQHITKFNYKNLENKFKQIGLAELSLEQKTTTHFLTPFIASFSYDFAIQSATKIPSAAWKNPFGNIILSRWKKKVSTYSQSIP
jgi:2-polyprenyl-3-methyl-5-hydroxy-6-metoxy-1,4-benzoquinol methylase